MLEASAANDHDVLRVPLNVPETFKERLAGALIDHGSVEHQRSKGARCGDGA